MLELADIKVPELRFPEFSGEWEERRGNEVFDRITDKNHKSDLSVLAISQEHGAIPREMIDYDISVTAESVASYKVVNPGDFIISLRSFQGGLEYSRYKGICSPAYIILRANVVIEDLFFKEFFKTYKYILQLKSKLEGIRDGKMVSYKYFSETILPFPTLPEQQKIAEFLTAVDVRIAKLKRKKELLEEYKRGMMQKLFSQEIRFKDEDGTDFPDWEERRLGEVAKIGTGNRDRVDSSDQGVYRFFDRSEDVRYMSEFDHEGEVVVVPGEGQSFKSTFYSGKYSLHQRVYGITNFDGVLAKWVFYLVVVDQKHFLSQAVGTTVKSLRTPIFVKWTIPVPSIGEQQKIADCLTGLDDKITTVANQIDKAAEFKRGLLQKMFV